MAAAYSFFGDNEFGARFCSSIAGTITCLLTYRLGVRMSSSAVGLFAGLSLAVAPMMIVQSKMATTDAVLSALLLGAFSCLWELYVAGFSWRWSLTFWFLLALAILTKGPFGPAFVACPVVTWAVVTRQVHVLKRLNWLPGLALMTAICLPWGLAIYRATNGEFYRVAIGQQALGHSLGAMNDHRGFPGYYVAIALAGLFPWSFLAPLALRGVRQWYREPGPSGLLLSWVVVPMIMLEFMRTKLPQYYLPAFPAWALLIARGVVVYHASGSRLVGTRRGLMRVTGLGAAALLGVVILAGWGARHLSGELRMPALAAAGVLAVGIPISGFLLVRRQDRYGWVAAVATLWHVGIVVAVWALPCAERCRIAHASAELLRLKACENNPVALFGYREPSLVFYFGRPIRTFGSPKELREFLDQHGEVFTLLREADLDKLSKKQPLICIEPRGYITAQPIAGRVFGSVQLARLSIRDDRGL
jgi:4-amino-4-deoxy-L-arabinose transferase-like glycosyltransferase